MIVISLTYVAPVEAVDAHLEAHVAWLKRGFADGVLLAAGRKVPRTGGLLIARGERAAIEAYAATDPFVAEGVATAEIIEVATSLVAPGLEALAT